MGMDLFPNEQNFDLDKSRQTFHHSLKEHHKVSAFYNISQRNITNFVMLFQAVKKILSRLV